MALVDLVKIGVNTTGTGALTLGAAVPGYRGKDALIDGETYDYSIQQEAQWEVGRCTFLSISSQIIRTPMYSSNGGSAVNLQAGAAIAFTILAETLSDDLATIAATLESVTADRIAVATYRAEVATDAAAAADNRAQTGSDRIATANDRAVAVAAANAANGFATAALAAKDAIALPANYYPTYAAMNADLGNIAANAFVNVIQDEQQNDFLTIYKKIGGAMVFQGAALPPRSWLGNTEKLRVSARNLVICWVGDSRVQSRPVFRTSYEAMITGPNGILKGCTSYNAGANGAQAAAFGFVDPTAQPVDYQYADNASTDLYRVVNAKPDIIYISLLTNDARLNTSARQIANMRAAMGRIISGLLKRTSGTIVLTVPAPIVYRNPDPQGFTDCVDANDAAQRSADMRQVYLEWEGVPRIIVNDTHKSIYGYRIDNFDTAIDLTTAAQVTVSTTSGSTTMTVTGVPAESKGPIRIGNRIVAAGVPATANVASFGTSIGGIGTLTMSAPATATATGVAASIGELGMDDSLHDAVYALRVTQSVARLIDPNLPRPESIHRIPYAVTDLKPYWARTFRVVGGGAGFVDIAAHPQLRGGGIQVGGTEASPGFGAGFPAGLRAMEQAEDVAMSGVNLSDFADLMRLSTGVGLYFHRTGVLQTNQIVNLVDFGPAPAYVRIGLTGGDGSNSGVLPGTVTQFPEPAYVTIFTTTRWTTPSVAEAHIPIHIALSGAQPLTGTAITGTMLSDTAPVGFARPSREVGPLVIRGAKGVRASTGAAGAIDVYMQNNVTGGSGATAYPGIRIGTLNFTSGISPADQNAWVPDLTNFPLGSNPNGPAINLAGNTTFAAYGVSGPFGRAATIELLIA